MKISDFKKAYEYEVIGNQLLSANKVIMSKEAYKDISDSDWNTIIKENSMTNYIISPMQYISSNYKEKKETSSKDSLISNPWFIDETTVNEPADKIAFSNPCKEVPIESPSVAIKKPIKVFLSNQFLKETQLKDSIEPKLKDVLNYFNNTAFNSSLNNFYSVLKKSKAFISGGFLRDLYINQSPTDMDIFFSSEAELKNVLSSLPIGSYKKSDLDNYDVKIAGFPYKIQLITVNYGSALEITNGFDFEQNKIAYSFADGQFYFPDLSWLPEVCIEEFKKLKVSNYQNNPVSAMARTAKFIQRGHGWSISEHEIIKLAKLINASLEPAKKEKWIAVMKS